MSIKFDTKTSIIDKNFKVDTVDESNMDFPMTDDGTDEVTSLLEDMSGYQAPGSSHVATTFDEYMVGDMDSEAFEAAAETQQFARSVPTLDELIKTNPKVEQHLDLVIDHYKRTEQKLRDYIKYLTDMMYTGQFNEREVAQATNNINNANGLIATCVKGAQDAEAKKSALYNLYVKEFRNGDLNNDGWIGQPYADGSLGVKELDSGQKVYINPTTGVAYDHPPHPDVEAPTVIGRGYDILLQDAEDYAPPFEGAPTSDVELCVSDLNALPDSMFGTSSELNVPTYLWVKADEKESFEPKLAFQKGTSDSTADTEPHYEAVDFVMKDGSIMQDTENIDPSKYVQVEVGSVEAYSREVDNGKGFVHYIEYHSADPSNSLIARICIREKKVDSWVPAASSELYASLPNDLFAVDTDSLNLEPLMSDAEQVEIINEKMSELGLGSITESEWSAMDYNERKMFLMQTGPCKVYASSSPLAVNTDEIDSYGMKLDFSGIKSTARLTTSLEQMEQALGLTRPDPSDEKAYRAYMESLSLFTDTSQMWAFQNHYRNPDDEWDYSYSTHDREWNWKDNATWIEINRNYDSQGSASVYIDPNAPEARAQTYNHLCRPDYVKIVDGGDSWDNSERPITETQATQITGVLIGGSGRPGHVIGTEYNDAIHVAEKNAKYDELKERFPWSEPIMPESAFNNTVIENVEVVRGHDANHYATGVTMAVIDGDSTSDNFIEAKAPVAAEFDGLLTDKPDWKASRRVHDRHQNMYTLPSNVKHYIHVDAGGTVAIDNPDETNDIIDSEWMSSAENNMTAEYYHDDYYDIVSSTDTLFGNIDDQDAKDAVPSGLSAGINELGAEGEIGNKLAEMAGLIQSEREKVDIPDYIESAAEEWVTQYGGAAKEMKGEMDDFFGTAFGEADNLWSELDAEEAGEVMGTVDETAFMNK